MRCMYDFCKSNSRTCLQYRKGRIENKKLKKHFKEFNDCFKCKN